MRKLPMFEPIDATRIDEARSFEVAVSAHP
jgi:hypothetical protein